MGQNIRQGTTPTIIFNVPINRSNINKLFLTFKRGADIVLEKTINDVINWYVENNKQKAEIELSQEDTLQFNEGIFYLQVRLLDTSNKAYVSTEKSFDHTRLLKGGVI